MRISLVIVTILIVVWHSPRVESAEGLLSRLSAKYEARVSADHVRYQLATQRLESLQQLKRLGHASIIEISEAELHVESIAASLAASKEMRQQLEGAALSVKSSENYRDVVLLQIGDFAADAGLQPLAQLELPSSQNWRDVAMMIQESSDVTNHRSEAWGELSRRVKKLRDVGQLTMEERIIDLKRQLSVAEETLAGHNFLPVQLGKQIDEVQIAGQTFRSEIQLAAFVFSSQHRSVPNEQKSVAQTAALRKASRELPPFAIQPTEAELQMARQACRRRVDGLNQKAGSLRNLALQLENRLAQLTQLAESDAFFAGEAKAVRLDLKIAKKSAQATQHRLEIRRAEFEFVTAVHNCVTQDDTAEITDWKTPLLRSFELRSLAAADKALLKQVVVKNSRTVAALDELLRDGHATWKEVEGAKVRMVDSKNQLRLASEHSRIYGNILTELKVTLAAEVSPAVARND